jgi:hypothetical protein
LKPNQPVSSPTEAISRRALDRRGFLKLAGAAGAAAFASQFIGGRQVAASPSPRIKVLSEDIKLERATLARGNLDGVLPSPRGLALAPGRSVGRYESSVLTATAPFTHVGLHWRADATETLQFQVRTSRDGQAWTDWEPVLLEAHASDAPSGETFGALISADRATRLQFRAELRGNGRGPQVESVTATLINSMDGPVTMQATSASTSPLPTLTDPEAQVFTRADWQLDDHDPDGTHWPRMFVPVKKLVVHHTATSNSYSTVEQAKADVRAIYHYHAVTLGWGDTRSSTSSATSTRGVPAVRKKPSVPMWLPATLQRLTTDPAASLISARAPVQGKAGGRALACQSPLAHR